MKNEILESLPLYLRIEIEENIIRKDWSQEELAKLQQRLADEFGKHRQVGRRTDIDKTSAKNFAEVDNRVLNAVGSVFKESGELVRQRLKVARMKPELLQEVDSGRRTITNVYNQVRVEENIRHLKPTPIPSGIFNVIYADPGWKYDNKITGGSMISGASQRYLTEDVGQIKNHPISKQIANDAICFLWCTTPMKIEALEVLVAWGFTYKTTLYWDKQPEKTAFKLGYWFNNGVEELLVGVRGKVKAFGMKDQNNIIHERATKHSEKPEIFRKIVERAAKAGLPYVKHNMIELYARTTAPGWQSNGNQLIKKQK